MANQGLEKLLRIEYKQYVDVYEMRYADGRLEPKSFIWDDGREYHIHKVVDICPGISRKAGVAGMRYTVIVIDEDSGQNRKTHMFLEEDKWFIIRRYPRQDSE